MSGLSAVSWWSAGRVRSGRPGWLGRGRLDCGRRGARSWFRDLHMRSMIHSTNACQAWTLF